MGNYNIVFQAASQEFKQKNIRSNVPLRAQEMAQAVADRIPTESGFDRVEAVRGYLNLYFKPAEFARRVVDEVLLHGGDFGRGKTNSDKIMVEYANLNTHKAFHVGHLTGCDPWGLHLRYIGFCRLRCGPGKLHGRYWCPCGQVDVELPQTA